MVKQVIIKQADTDQFKEYLRKNLKLRVYSMYTSSNNMRNNYVLELEGETISSIETDTAINIHTMDQNGYPLMTTINTSTYCTTIM